MKSNILRVIQLLCYLLFSLFININNGYTQLPEIQWQNAIGGNGAESLTSIENTDDGGYILGGYSDSGISGDKSEINRGDNDYWIVKINSSGNIEWEKTFGGSGGDALLAVKQTNDGGYILAGFSDSGISGDKTESSLGGNDYWIIKINSTGILEWQNTIGGGSDDYLNSIIQTPDDGFLLGGSSHSGISGDKTETVSGFDDYWIVKTDNAGNIEWQNTIGGNGNEALTSLNFTLDGNFIIGGYSDSELSGDKTEASNGLFDYWILKLDINGNIIWQNTIGGTSNDNLGSITPTEDGGFIIAGQSSSGISGDKTEPIHGSTDFWVVKTDMYGNILWQKNIGGNGSELLPDIKQCVDNGFILSGGSSSGISGDKNEAYGKYDYWALGLDEIGNIIWQRSMGGSQNDFATSVVQSADGGYCVAGYSGSGSTGNKTENVNGLLDYWIVKLNAFEAVCTVPIDLNSTVLLNSAKLSWMGDAVRYRVRYRVEGFDTWLYKFTNDDKEFVVVKDLNCNTEYEWQVMSICATDGSSYSEYSSSDYFATNECRFENDSEVPEILIFPNPASDLVNISISHLTGDAQICIFNLQGDLIFKNNIVVDDIYQMSWNTGSASSGIYQLQVKTKDHIYLNKIMITK